MIIPRYWNQFLGKVLSNICGIIASTVFQLQYRGDERRLRELLGATAVDIAQIVAYLSHARRWTEMDSWTSFFTTPNQWPPMLGMR